MKIVCYKCKHEMELAENDLINVGREQITQEILEVLGVRK